MTAVRKACAPTAQLNAMEFNHLKTYFFIFDHFNNLSIRWLVKVNLSGQYHRQIYTCCWLLKDIIALIT